MSSFSKNYDSSQYTNYRPYYPLEFYKKLAEWAPETELCVDIGCGPGTASTKLASEVAKHVIAIDPSSSMIETASKTPAENVEFRIGTDDALDSMVEPESVDLVTAAQCAHWFKYPDFFEKVYKILKPNGKLALWGYADPYIVEHPAAHELIQDYAYGSEMLGPYWDPGRQLLRNLYRDIPLPDKFSVGLNDPLQGSAADYNKHMLPIELRMSRSQLLGYFKTYSSYHNWGIAHPNAKPENDPIKKIDIQLSQLGMKSQELLTVRWSTILILLTKGSKILPK